FLRAACAASTALVVPAPRLRRRPPARLAFASSITLGATRCAARYGRQRRGVDRASLYCSAQRAGGQARASSGDGGSLEMGVLEYLLEPGDEERTFLHERGPGARHLTHLPLRHPHAT